MIFIDLIHEAYLKINIDKKNLTKGIIRIDRPYFIFMKRNLFAEKSYSEIPDFKKVLFKNEEEYKIQKFIFEELNDIYKFRTFIFTSVYFFTGKKIIFGRKKFLENFNLNFFKNSFLYSPKIFLIKIFFLGFLSVTYFNLETFLFKTLISKKIKSNTRLGLYLWFDSNFRLGLLNTQTLNYLDNQINNISLFIDEKQTQMNEDNLNIICFYYLLKQHYLNIYISKFFINIIIPMINNKNPKFSDFVEKIKNEKYFYYCNINDEEYNDNILLWIKILNFFKYKNEKDFFSSSGELEKIFVNEDSINNLIGEIEIRELKKNEFILEELNNFYNSTKKI